MPDSRSLITASSDRQPSQRIRILFLIPSFKTGGAEIQLLSLVRGLDKSLFSITVAAFYNGNELDPFYENISSVKIVYLHKKGAIDFSFLQRLVRLVKQQDVHIIQSYNISARLFGTITAKLAGVPISIVTERTARVLYSSPGSRIHVFFEKFAMRSATLLIANSEAGRDFAVSRGIKRQKTRVIYNGIDPHRLELTSTPHDIRNEFHIPQNAFLVGMVARIERLKDPFVFVEAAHQLSANYDRVYFMLIGDGSLLDAVKKQIVELKLQQRFIVTGYRSDTAHLINAMDVFILTSKEVEGCSNAIIEALSFGKPVIATDVGGNRELIQHEYNGLLISPSDVSQLVDALARLYDDSALRHRLSARAQKSAERFRQSAMVSAHEQLYVELVKRHEERTRE